MRGQLNPKKPEVIIFHSIVLLLLGLTLFGPWWSISITSSGSFLNYSSETSFKLREMSTTRTSGASTTASTRSYGELLEEVRRWDYEETVDDTIGSINLTFYMVVAALVLAVMSIIVCFRGPKTIVLAALLVASLLPPAYFTFGFPAAVNKDFEDMGFGGAPAFEVSFMGSTTSTSGGTTSKARWGPGWGWFSSATAAGIALIGVLVVMERETPRRKKS
jgi:hypothetical protein